MNEIRERIESQMRALNLKGMINRYRELADGATKGKLRYEEYLSLLLEKN